MSTNYRGVERFERTVNSSNRDTKEFIYGKVTKVYTNTGDTLSEGAIEYASSTQQTLPSVAYPVNYNFQHIPLLGETVALYHNTTLQKLYYGLPLNIHNFPTHNSTDEIVADTPDYVEPSTINPLTTFTGDTILQGRFGQSLRFTQTIPNTGSPWQSSKQGSSIVALSSGQVPTNDGSSLIIEDLDQDPAILVLQENGKLTYEGTDEYEGDQAYLASNRVVIKARRDVVNISTENGSIILSPDTLSIEAATTEIAADTLTATGTSVSLNYERIALGENATSPLIKSPELLTDLAALNAQLTALSTALTGVTVLLAALPGGQAPAAALQTAAANLTTQANTISTKVGSGAYLSTKAFTE